MGIKDHGWLSAEAVGAVKGVIALQAVLDAGSTAPRRYSNRDLGALLKCSEATIRRRGAQALGLGAVIKSGKPRKEDKRTPEKNRRRNIIDEMMTNESGKISAQIIVAKLLLEHNISVDRRTVYRDLKDAGWTLKRRPSCPNMRTPEAMANRLVFAKKMLADLKAGRVDVHDFVFTDECYLRAGDFHQWQWCKGDDKPEPLAKEGWAPKCHIFGLLYEKGVLLVRLPKEGSGPKGGLASKDFVEVLNQNIVRLRRQTKSKTIVLDGAPIHTAANTVAWLEKKKFDVVENWPAHSPDLNPIENFWAILKMELDDILADDLKGDAESADVIWTEALNASKRVEKETFANLVLSFQRRLQACVDANGDWTGY